MRRTDAPRYLPGTNIMIHESSPPVNPRVTVREWFRMDRLAKFQRNLANKSMTEVVFWFRAPVHEQGFGPYAPPVPLATVLSIWLFLEHGLPEHPLAELVRARQMFNAEVMTRHLPGIEITQ